MTKRKFPTLKCYDCKKLMIRTHWWSYEVYDGDKLNHIGDHMNMECPDKCKGQPKLTFKEMGPFWKNITTLPMI